MSESEGKELGGWGLDTRKPRQTGLAGIDWRVFGWWLQLNLQYSITPTPPPTVSHRQVSSFIIASHGHVLSNESYRHYFECWASLVLNYHSLRSNRAYETKSALLLFRHLTEVLINHPQKLPTPYAA